MTQPDIFSAPTPRPVETVHARWERPTQESETSVLAAIDMAEVAPGLEQKVYDFLLEYGPHTDDAIQDALAMSGNTERPRRRSLEKKGLVRQVGVAKSGSGRSAAVWGVV